jgi:S1-C subfamily serine protease
MLTNSFLLRSCETRRVACGIGAVLALVFVASCGSEHDSRVQLPGPVPTALRDIRPITPVRVRASGCGPVERTAVGFSAGPGLVATAAHSLRGAVSVTIDGASARVVALDHRRDLALLRLDDDTPGARKAVNVAEVNVAAAVAHAGAEVAIVIPAADGPVRARVGRVGPITMDEPADGMIHRRDGLVLRVLDSGRTIRRGDSGAAVTDTEGRLIGVVFATDRAEGTTAFAVSVSELTSLLAATGRSSASVATGECDW